MADPTDDKPSEIEIMLGAGTIAMLKGSYKYISVEQRDNALIFKGSDTFGWANAPVKSVEDIMLENNRLRKQVECLEQQLADAEKDLRWRRYKDMPEQLRPHDPELERKAAYEKQYEGLEKIR